MSGVLVALLDEEVKAVTSINIGKEELEGTWVAEEFMMQLLARTSHFQFRWQNKILFM